MALCVLVELVNHILPVLPLNTPIEAVILPAFNPIRAGAIARTANACSTESMRVLSARRSLGAVGE